ncbi:hypothetical protein ACET3Z_017250 [Daucus carota]
MQSLSSPSFHTYSPSDKLSQIAARVVDEFQSDDEFIFEHNNNNEEFIANDNDDNEQREEDDEESEFEFPQAPLSPIPADEIFSNGQIRPVYPLFNTELVFGNTETFPQISSYIITPKASARLPLGKLFIEERENCTTSSSSSSSSESDELDKLPAETYCVWKPNTGDNPRELRKKSSSAGTNSKRWKFRDLLHKSNSDGNETFDFLGHKKAPVKESDARRSYLPHKKDLVELFFNVNGVSRHVNPY